MTKIMPEIHHDYKNLTMEQVNEAYLNGTTVTGFVEEILANAEELKVKLGNGIYASLPYSEVTIYPFRYSKRTHSKIPTNVKCLSNKKIRVKVTSVLGDTIIVSRKKNMEQAYEEIKKFTSASLYITEVIDRSAFGDIGEGLVGKLYINEVSQCHVHSVREVLSRGQTVNVAILDIDDEQRINVSYKQTFKPYCQEDYYIGMIINCNVADWIKVTDISKYYVSITPQVSGIMTVNEHMHIPYHSNVECVVTGINDKGLSLELVRVL